MNEISLLFGGIVVALVGCVLVWYFSLRASRSRVELPENSRPAETGCSRDQAAALEKQTYDCIRELADLIDELALAVEYLAKQTKVESPLAEDSEEFDDVLAEAWRGIVAGAEGARRLRGCGDGPIAWRWVFRPEASVATDLERDGAAPPRLR